GLGDVARAGAVEALGGECLECRFHQARPRVLPARVAPARTARTPGVAAHDSSIRASRRRRQTSSYDENLIDRSETSDRIRRARREPDGPGSHGRSEPQSRSPRSPRTSEIALSITGIVT